MADGKLYWGSSAADDHEIDRILKETGSYLERNLANNSMINRMRFLKRLTSLSISWHPC